MKLRQKTILITGGTSGVGRALVEELEPDNQLIVLAKDPHKIRVMRQTYPNVSFVQVDLSNMGEVEQTIACLKTDWPHIDLLINNAAIQNTPAFNDASFNPASIQTEITINFTAICFLIHGLLPMLKTAKKGGVLNVNSGLGLVAKSSSAVYCATKGAMNLLSQSLRYQLKTDGIVVMQAFLPLVDTAMTAGRGSGKLSASDAAKAIMAGIEREQLDHHIGKVRLLIWIHRWLPSLAKKIMQKS